MEFSLIMLLCGLIPVLFFKQDHLKEAYPKNLQLVPKINKVVYLTVFINCIYAILCKSVGKMFLLAAEQSFNVFLEASFYLGAIGGCAIYFLIYFLLKNSNQTTWNVTFSTFVAAMLLYAFSNGDSVTLTWFSVLLGIGSTMGMINMYYILGVIGKKYFSIRYVRISVFFIGVCGGASGVLLGS